MIKIAINGVAGRIGKLVARTLYDRLTSDTSGTSDKAGRTGFDIVLMNDIGADADMIAHLLTFDSVHGRWSGQIASTNNGLIINGKTAKVTAEKRIEDLALDALDVDLVIDCTGVFKTTDTLAPYFAGQKRRKVLVSAPVKRGALNLVVGVNDGHYKASVHDLVTAASCTTNCLAPVVKVVHETFGIRHGSMTTIHDVTNTQTIVDRPHKDYRRARSALMNLIPTTTGSAKAITMIFPELQGRLDGHAVRVPLLNASLTDCVFELEREVTVSEVNAAFEAAASSGPLKGILGYEPRPLVSTDYTNDPRSSIVDALSTMVVNGTHLKIYAWYDNEMGYAMRMGDLAEMMVAHWPA